MFVCELNLSWEWMHRKNIYMLCLIRCLVLSWEWMHKWHPEYPGHVSEFECLPLGSNPGHKVTKKRV